MESIEVISEEKRNEEYEENDLIVKWQKLKDEEKLKSDNRQKLLEKIKYTFDDKIIRDDNQYVKLLRNFEQKKLALKKSEEILKNAESRKSLKEEEFKKSLEALRVLEIPVGSGLSFTGKPRILSKKEVSEYVEKQIASLEADLKLGMQVFEWKQILEKEKMESKKDNIVKPSHEVDTILALQEENNKQSKKIQNEIEDLERCLLQKKSMYKNQVAKVNKVQKKEKTVNEDCKLALNQLEDITGQLKMTTADSHDLKERRNLMINKLNKFDYTHNWFINGSLLQDYQNTLEKIQELEMKNEDLKNRLNTFRAPNRETSLNIGNIDTKQVIRPRLHKSNFKTHSQ